MWEATDKKKKKENQRKICIKCQICAEIKRKSLNFYTRNFEKMRKSAEMRNSHSPAYVNDYKHHIWNSEVYRQSQFITQRPKVWKFNHNLLVCKIVKYQEEMVQLFSKQWSVIAYVHNSYFFFYLDIYTFALYHLTSIILVLPLIKHKTVHEISCHTLPESTAWYEHCHHFPTHTIHPYNHSFTVNMCNSKL